MKIKQIFAAAAPLCAALLIPALMLLPGCGQNAPAESSSGTAAEINEVDPLGSMPFPSGGSEVIPESSPEPESTAEPGPTRSHEKETAYAGKSFPYTRLPGLERLELEDFGAERITSPFDADADGIDDQTDIFNGAKNYLDKQPQYDAGSWYKAGYPSPDAEGVIYGVCTDVIAFALQEAGYDLMEMVWKDIEEHPDWYANTQPPGEKQIAFRRVRNLKVFFEHHADSLTLDLSDSQAWQPGDIVVFYGSSNEWNGHIAIISDRRADDGVPYVLHHANPGQTLYEEDYLVSTSKRLVGHYRYCGFNNQ